MSKKIYVFSEEVEKRIRRRKKERRKEALNKGKNFGRQLSAVSLNKLTSYMSNDPIPKSGAKSAKSGEASKRNAGNILISCCVALMGMVLTANMMHVRSDNEKEIQAIAEIQQMIEEEQKRSDDLTEYHNYISEYPDEYVEKTAREKFGFIYPGEIVFVESES